MGFDLAVDVWLKKSHLSQVRPNPKNNQSQTERSADDSQGNFRHRISCFEPVKREDEDHQTRKADICPAIDEPETHVRIVSPRK